MGRSDDRTEQNGEMFLFSQNERAKKNRICYS